MRLAILFSGGKDSTYAAFLAKQKGHNIVCLLTISSKNMYSYMFHTPSISQVQKQADAMGIPLLLKETKGEKELELQELEDLISEAKTKYKIKGVVTGAVESVYQSTRIQNICNKLKLECFNPLWQKDQVELLNDLIKSRFEAIVVGVAAFPLDRSYLGRTIDLEFVRNMRLMQEKYKINPAGEGGEYESFVLNCPLFKRPLTIKRKGTISSGDNHRLEVVVE